MFTDLKRLMRASGMPTVQIAGRARCNQRTLQLWLDGTTAEPSLPLASRVAALLGRSIELSDGEARLVDTPASVAAKLANAREFIGYWRRWQ